MEVSVMVVVEVVMGVEVEGVLLSLTHWNGSSVLDVVKE